MAPDASKVIDPDLVKYLLCANMEVCVAAIMRSKHTVILILFIIFILSKK